MPIVDCAIAEDAVITHPDLVNIYGCSIGAGSRVGPFVEIQRGSRIGARCKVSSHSFVCEGVEIEDEVMIAHGVMFTNDLFPRAVNADGSLQGAEDWAEIPTRVCDRASIGSNATLIAGITVGEGAVIGAGAVVTRDVEPWTLVAGNPARLKGRLDPTTGRKL